MISWLRGAAIVAACLALVVQASPAGADVHTVTGGAAGVSITGDLGAIAPTPTVALSANEASPPSALGPFAASAASVTLPTSLPFNVFSTGALTVSTSAANVAGDDAAGRVESEALVRNVVLGPGFATASSIASSCTADDSGARGTTVIEGGTLNGAPFPPTPNPAPNTVVPVPGLGTVTLNEQVPTNVTNSTGTSAGLVVIAVHARSASGGGGILPQDQSAEAVIAQVVCEAARSDSPMSSTTVAPTATTSPPATSRPPAPHGTLPSTGSETLLPYGVIALALGGLVRVSVRSVGRRPR